MREIFIEKRNNIRRVALKEHNKLIECFIEEEKNEPIPGEIYKGVVKNIVPAIKSAFVDIGYDKKAYMYLTKDNIKKGEELLVEVVKEELGDKGAKILNHVTLPGRYVVLTNERHHIGFSKKIENQEFKEEVLNKIKVPEGLGIMIRTQGEKVSLSAIEKELEHLYNKYLIIEREFKYSLKPGLLHGEKSIINKILRDAVNDETKKITVDSEEDFESIKGYIKDKEDITIELSLYKEHRTLFDYYGIEKEILALRNNRVNLECGGHIVIEKTEAMYVIDINSGKNVIGRSIDRTAYTTNIQAAEEIARQIRLRNLSGIIVVDFIDMEEKNDKKKIIRTLINGFEGDKNKTMVYPHTELNLVQIARRRRGKNIYEYIEEQCKCCKGHGKRLKLSYVTLLIKNEILKKDAENNIHDIYIEVNSMYKDIVREDLFNFIKDIDGLNKNIYLNFTDIVEYFNVEPLIFSKQIESLMEYKVDFSEK
ncbi:ribonuclease E/G [Clostridium sp.]|uniref:ribonuclease E/G n=1 Tax=Clostridium sp. TaxID=1506 RepID=UPI003464AED8